MVNRVVPADQLMENVAAWAGSLASGPTLAFGLTKRAMNQAWQTDLFGALEAEAYLQEIAGRSHDNKEGVAAFLEKRAAQFTGS